LRPDRVHNDYLNTLVDWGVAGAMLVAAALGLLGAGLWKTWRFIRGTPRDLGEQKTSNKFAFVLGASAGLAAILFHSVVDFNMHIPANAILAVTLMALLSSHLRFATDRCWFTARPWAKALASGIFVAGIIYLGTQARRSAREYVWLTRALEAPRFSKEQVELFTRAFEIEPKNGETAAAIGEALRIQSQEGAESYIDSEGDYRGRAAQAMEWLARGMKLNPWNATPFLGYGWCLDWLQRPGESGPYFDRAEELDPASFIVTAAVGRHYVELGDNAAAKPWFERSLRLQPAENPIAQSYLQVVDLALRESATNDLRARLSSPVR
jgi:tetratricopeptide (TPR) repeat protein